MTEFRILLLVIACTLAGCSQEVIRYEKFSSTLQSLKALQDDYGFPEHLESEDARKIESDLNLMEYFEIFEHLEVRSGYTLDWVYNFQGLGGTPALYIREMNRAPFETYSEFIDSVREEAELDKAKAIEEKYAEKARELYSSPTKRDMDSEEREKRLGELVEELESSLAKLPRSEYWNWWKEYIETDGTDEGYLEFAAISIMGTQFALYWHAHYNDRVIIPDEESLIEILDTPYWSYTDEELFLPKRVVKKARKLKPWPDIKRENGQVSVTLLTFSKWGGFERQIFVFSETAPHVLITNTQEVLVPFDCGIQF